MNLVYHSHRRATLVALAGVVAAGAIWLALATATGLIFHLMPAGPPLLGGILLRRGRQRAMRAAATVIGVGALVSMTVAIGLISLGQPLDDPWWTIVVLGIGMAIGLAIARRQPHAVRSD